MTFAEQLQRARERRNISQSELAEMVGISRSAICNYENGNRENPSYPIIVAIANALDVPVNALIGERMDIYSRIDARLNEKHMSRRKLAIAAGIPESTIAAAFARRSKKMSLENIQRIADVLNVSINDLMGDGEAPESPISDNAPQCIRAQDPHMREQLETCIEDLNDGGLYILLSVARSLHGDEYFRQNTA